LISGWEVSESIGQPETSRLANEWFSARFNQELGMLNDHFTKYRLSEALMSAYKLFWDDFSSWYLEIIKPAYGYPIDLATRNQAFVFMEQLMLVLHPFIPFITEEIWQRVALRQAGESVMITLLPQPASFESDCIERFERMKEVVGFVRGVRAERNIPIKKELSIEIKTGDGKYDDYLDPILIKLLNLKSVSLIEQNTTGSASQVIRSVEYYVPVAGAVDVDAECEKLQKDLEYTMGFLDSVKKKLSNERFVNHAPAQVVDVEKAKMADAEAKIKALLEQIEAMRNHNE
jgi:valyl-tRNA synthetase